MFSHASKLELVEQARAAGFHVTLHVIMVPADLAGDATFWDNSRHDGPARVAALRAGELDGVAQWPDWAPAVLVQRWHRSTAIR